MSLQELKDKIENIKISYDYEQTYCDLHNTCIDYMNETQDFSLDSLFDEYYDSEIVEEITKKELQDGGLYRLYYFLGNADLRNELFRINAYGNLEDIDIEDLECLKESILDEINDKIGGENND